MTHVMALIVGLSFIILYKNFTDTKQVQKVVQRKKTGKQWHHALALSAIALNVPQLVQAGMHPNAIYAFAALLVLAVWLGIKHRTEGLAHSS